MSFKAPAGCNGYLQVDLTTPVINVPCTQLGWVKFETGIAAHKTVFANGSRAAQSHRIKFILTNRVQALVNASVDIDIDSINNDIALDTWYLLAFVIAGNSDHKLYINTLNGTHKLYEITNTRGAWSFGEFITSISIASMDLLNQGGIINQGEYIKVGETAFYNKALTIAELDDLATGASPATLSNCLALYRGRQAGNEGDALTSTGLADSTENNPDLMVRRTNDGTEEEATIPVVFSTDNPLVDNPPLVLPSHVTFDVVIDNDDTPAPDATGVSYKLSTGTRSSNSEKKYFGDDGIITDGQMTILTPDSINGDELILSGDITSTNIFDENTLHIRGVGTVTSLYTGQDVWLQFDGATQYLELT